MATATSADSRTERRIQLRIAALLHERPSDRAERIWARSVADLARVRARAEGIELTPEEGRRLAEHVARVGAEWLGLDENMARALAGDR